MIQVEYDGEARDVDSIKGWNCYVLIERMAGHRFDIVINDGKRRVVFSVGTADKYRRQVMGTVVADEPQPESEADSNG